MLCLVYFGNSLPRVYINSGFVIFFFLSVVCQWQINSLDLSSISPLLRKVLPIGSKTFKTFRTMAVVRVGLCWFMAGVFCGSGFVIKGFQFVLLGWRSSGSGSRWSGRVRGWVCAGLGWFVAQFVVVLFIAGSGFATCFTGSCCVLICFSSYKLSFIYLYNQGYCCYF